MPTLTLDRPASPASSMPDLAPAIALDQVSVRFTTERGTVTALERINLTVQAGGFITLLGPSGCGKSTLLRVVADLIAPTSGTVQVLGGEASAARERRDIGFVFQDAALLPWRTAQQNVELPLEVGGGRARPGKRSPRELLALVGLAGWENAYPHELSGGMRQRVSIARALVNDPKLLLMDEPFGALDEITRERLNDELLRLFVEQQFAGLFITHSVSEAVYLSTKVVVMSGRPGRIVDTFEVPFDVPRDPEIRYTPEFARLVGEVSHALREGHS